MRRFQKRQGMFADPEIPVGVADPLDIEFILETKPGFSSGRRRQFVENDPVVDAFDPYFATVAFVE